MFTLHPATRYNYLQRCLLSPQRLTFKVKHSQCHTGGHSWSPVQSKVMTVITRLSCVSDFNKKTSVKNLDKFAQLIAPPIKVSRMD